MQQKCSVCFNAHSKGRAKPAFWRPVASKPSQLLRLISFRSNWKSIAEKLTLVILV